MTGHTDARAEIDSLRERLAAVEAERDDWREEADKRWLLHAEEKRLADAALQREQDALAVARRYRDGFTPKQYGSSLYWFKPRVPEDPVWSDWADPISAGERAVLNKLAEQ